MTRSPTAALALAVVIVIQLALASCTNTEVLGRLPKQRTPSTSDRDSGGPESDASVLPITAGALEHRGDILLVEHFDDARFTARGWYDGPGGVITEDGVSGGAFVCNMSPAEPCARPGRIAFDEQESLYVSYWLKFSQEYELREEVGQLFLLTNQDDVYVGPAVSHLTVYFFQHLGVPEIGLIDTMNVDQNCVRLTDGSILGCDGDFSSYQFTEERSVNGCNASQGNPSNVTCSPNNYGGYYSFRGFAAISAALSDAPGSMSKATWHLVEVLVELNSVQDGVGVADGRLRYWFDGSALIDADGLILRTGQYPQMRLQHLLVAPIALDSQQQNQKLFMDELTVAVGVR